MTCLPRFEYIAPETMAEACSLLALHKDQAKIVSGGTDLLAQMKQRDVMPQYLIGLKSVPGLDYVEYDIEVGLRIGALATLAQVAGSPVVGGRFPLLSEAIMQMASVQVRNIGTVAGNLCNGSPAADTAPSLIVMGAKVKIIHAGGQERIIPLVDFFLGPGKTSLKQGEVLAEVQVPNQSPQSGGTYLKLSPRRAMDLATVGVACLLVLDGKVCKDIRIALGAVAPTPIRAKKAEAIIRGGAPKEEVLDKAATAAMEESQTITDVRGSAEYRRKMVGVLTKRAVRQAWQKASAGQ